MKAKELDGKTFYKISKSTLDIRNLCSESHYISYPENQIVQDTGSHYLCFVPPECTILCVHYGNQLTEIKFDSGDFRFKEIANEEIYFGGLIWNEYNAKKIITGKNYSLSNPETIQKIVDMASSKNLLRSICMDENKDRYSISVHLEKLGLYEALKRWEKIKKEVKNEYQIRNI